MGFCGRETQNRSFALRTLADEVKKYLLHKGVMIHQYQAHDINGIYMELDGGVSGSLCISDTVGKKRHTYSFNLLLDKRGVHTERNGETVLKFYGPDSIQMMLDDIVTNRELRKVEYRDKGFDKVVSARVQDLYTKPGSSKSCIRVTS